jgi:hypothetical protein
MISDFPEHELGFTLFFFVADTKMNLLFSHCKLLELISFDSSIDL